MSAPSPAPNHAPVDAVPIPPAPSADGPYAAWGSRDFRYYAASWFSITFSKLAETVAVGVFLYQKTEDPLSLAWIGLVQAAPVILLAIAGGQIADRFDRRRVMMGSLALSTASALGLVYVARAEWATGWFYPFLALAAISQALGSPSRAALLPQVVPKAHFTNAVTWTSTVFQIAMMTGPVVGGAVLSVGSPMLVFAVVAACRLVALAAVAKIRARPDLRPKESVSWSSLAAGIRFVGRTKLILATITLDLFAVLLGGAAYLMPVFAKQRLDLGSLQTFLAWACGVFGTAPNFDPVAAAVGLLRSAEAVGAVAMAVLLAHLPPMRRAGRTLLWSVGGFGAATIVFGLSTSFPLSLATVFVIGALDNISVVVRHTLVQMLTPDAMRGRVSAVNNIFIVASNDLGGFESGVTAKLFGAVTSVVAGGICAIAAVLATARIWPEVRALGSLGDVRPAVPPDEPPMPP
jgi:MFS family permease